MILPTDYNFGVNPLQHVLDNGLGVIGQAITTAIQLGKGRMDLQNSQENTTFDLLGREEANRRRKLEFAVGQANTNRAFQRGVLEDERDFGRTVQVQDRAFGEGVRQSNRTFDYGVSRDKVTDARAERDFGLREKQATATLSLAEQANTRANVQANSAAALNALKIQEGQAAAADDAAARKRAEDQYKNTHILFEQSESGFRPKKDTTSVQLQDYLANNAGSRDERVQSAVNAGQVELQRRIKSSTVEALTPEVQSLTRKIEELNTQLSTTKESGPAKAIGDQIKSRQKVLDTYIAEFPELGKISKGLQTTGAVGDDPGAVSLNDLLKKLNIKPKK